VTAVEGFTPPMPYGQRLHRGDGYRGGDPVCGPCFRLVTEGPANGTPRRLQSSRSFVPYKLFERVAGAEIEIAAPPGTEVRLELDLETPSGRSFVFEVSAQATPDGWARPRVPYATDVTPPVHARGLYRLHIGDALQSLAISDETVRSGTTISVQAASSSAL